MAVNVGGVYFTAELDDSKLKLSVKDIQNSIQNMSNGMSKKFKCGYY